MNRHPILACAAAVSLGMGLALAGIAAPTSAVAQYTYPYAYTCPPGYYYDPVHGCVPAVYLYGPPYYPYPDFGFDFFYGGGWGRGYRGGGHPGDFRRGGGVPRGGGFAHGGGPHGGGHRR